MPTTKSRQGGAYITVLTATMLILLLATVTLSVTAVSRRLTALYQDYIGLYDLAIAGNEQALFLLLQAFDARANDIHNRAWQRTQDEIYLSFEYYNGNLHLDAVTRAQFQQIFITEAMHDLRPAMASMFSRHFFMYQRTWGLDAIIDTAERRINDSYRAVTTICAACTHFHLDTVVHRYVNNEPGAQAIVESTINWTISGHREVILNNNGVISILFLDEFTLAMVESLRIQIGIHDGRREAWGC